MTDGMTEGARICKEADDKRTMSISNSGSLEVIINDVIMSCTTCEHINERCDSIYCHDCSFKSANRWTPKKED